MDSNVQPPQAKTPFVEYKETDSKVGLKSAISKLSPKAVRYMEAVSNPFGTDANHIDHIDRNADVRVPKPGSPATYCYTWKRHALVNYSLGYTYVTGVSLPTKDKGVRIWEVSGTTAGGTATTNAIIVDDVSGKDWWAAGPCQSYRIVAGAVRINPSGAATTASAIMRGGCKDTTLPYDGNVTYATWATLDNNLEQQSFSATQGITVRFNPLQNSENTGLEDIYTLPDTTKFNFVDANFAWSEATIAPLPRIKVDCIASGTYELEVVMYFEVIPPTYLTCPIACSKWSNYDDYDRIMAILNNEELFSLVTDGHSFKSFMESVANFFKGAVSWIAEPEHLKLIGNVAKTILPFVM